MPKAPSLLCQTSAIAIKFPTLSPWVVTMGWSGFLKGLSATLVAIVLIGGGGFLAVQYLVGQYTAPPPRPTFSNDTPPQPKPVAAKETPAPAPKAEASPSPSPTPSPKPSPTGYRARITLSDGLNVRQGPTADSERVDGVDYNDEVTVLEESADKEWLKIRVESTGAEGWIKSGYIEKVN